MQRLTPIQILEKRRLVDQIRASGYFNDMVTSVDGSTQKLTLQQVKNIVSAIEKVGSNDMKRLQPNSPPVVAPIGRR